MYDKNGIVAATFGNQSCWRLLRATTGTPSISSSSSAPGPALPKRMRRARRGASTPVAFSAVMRLVFEVEANVEAAGLVGSVATALVAIFAGKRDRELSDGTAEDTDPPFLAVALFFAGGRTSLPLRPSPSLSTSSRSLRFCGDTLAEPRTTLADPVRSSSLAPPCTLSPAVRPRPRAVRRSGGGAGPVPRTLRPSTPLPAFLRPARPSVDDSGSASSLRSSFESRAIAPSAR